MQSIIFTSLIMLFSSLSALAQNLQYQQFFPLRMGTAPSIEGVEIKQTYRLSRNELVVVGDLLEEQNYGLHLFYLKRADVQSPFQEVFRSSKAIESLAINPNFFRASDLSIIIITSGNSSRKAWGEQLFLFQEGKVEELGGLNITIENEADYHQLLQHLKISKEEDKIFFRISSQQLMLRPENTNSNTPQNIEYIYENGVLKLVE